MSIDITSYFTIKLPEILSILSITSVYLLFLAKYLYIKSVIQRNKIEMKDKKKCYHMTSHPRV